jgi:hypothetical protein
MVPPTTDGTAIPRALASVATQARARARRFDSTAMWDAIFAGASLVVEHRGRPVVVVLSDGADNASWLFTNQPEQARWIRAQKERTIDALRGSGIVIDVVWVPAFRTPGLFRDKYYGALSPDEPAESTGGVAFSAADRNPGRRIAERLQALRSGYVLTYTPAGVPQGDGWHDLKVRLKHRRGKVEARPGYISGSAR